MSVTTAQLQEQYGRYYKWFATTTVMVGVMGTITSSTMVNVAIADIMGTFGVGQDMAQWLSTAFLSAMTVAMLVNAWLQHAFGIRAVYLGAIALFGASSLLGAIAPNIYLVIVARVLQGVCAGLLQPLAMATIFPLFPLDSRGKAMGIFAMGVVFGTALGPLIAGLIVDEISWRHIFTAMVPICMIGAVLGSVFLPSREKSLSRTSFNWTSLCSVTIAVATLLIGISKGPSWGWSSTTIGLLFGTCGIAIVTFIESERRSQTSLMGTQLLGSLHFTSCVIVSFIFGGALFSSMYLIPVFVRLVQNLDATTAGLVLLPSGLALMAVFPIAGKVADKVHMGYPVIIGLTVFALSTLALAFADADSAFWTLAGWTILGRVSLGFIFPALDKGALAPISADMLKYGTSLINFSRMLGGALGVNVTAVILEHKLDFHSQMLNTTQTWDNSSTQTVLTEVSRSLRHTGLTDLEIIGLSFQYLSQTVLTQANVLAFQDGFFFLGIVGFLSLVPAIFIIRKPKSFY